MALDVEIGSPASFVGQPQAYVSIRDTIRTCAKGVAEGFALQAFAQMPMGQGRVGVFLFPGKGAGPWFSLCWAGL